MKKKRRSAEQILKILQEIDASQAQGSTVEKACREQEISDATYYINPAIKYMNINYKYVTIAA